MTYCKEYKDWVDPTVEESFSIRETSAKLSPGQTNDNVKCDGIGFIGMYKQEDGLLMLKFPKDNELDYKLTPYPTISKKLRPTE